MKTQLEKPQSATVAITVAPEDLRRGDYVAVLSEVVEFPSCNWFDLTSHPLAEPVRVRMLPCDAGMPMKVKAICLPFVFAITPYKQSESLDVRSVQFVRVSKRYARCAWKQARKERNRQSRLQG